MLNGLAPILIFTFPPLIGIDLSKVLGGIPVIGSSLSSVGVPIPIYLDERLTGVFIESESKSIDVDTDITPRYQLNPSGAVQSTTLINQSGLNNLVTINMVASKDNIILSVLLALNDMIFQRLISGKYRVSYLNGTTLVFGGLLHSFQTSSSSDDTLLKITMQIQKNNTAAKAVVGQYADLKGDITTLPGKVG